MKKIHFLILSLLFSSLPSIVIAVGYTDVTVSEAKAMIDSDPSLVVLDVRNQSEYYSGHIRNAKLIPVHKIINSLDELDETRACTHDVIVYSKSGERSDLACQVLVDNGFSHVYNMFGGIMSWMDAGYDVYVRYPSIQDAVDQAGEGDAICVSSGTYHGDVVVDKTVSLVGENHWTTFIKVNWSKGERGFYIVHRNVNLSEFTISNGIEGIYLTDTAGNCVVKDCHILGNDVGIFIKSDYNLFTRNLIANNTRSGIEIYSSCICSPVKGNMIIGNNFINNVHGVLLENANASLIYHNNFIQNVHQATFSIKDNIWDDGYPSGGNYWSDYHNPDLHSGSKQNQYGSDGIGDIPYNVWGNNDTDDFPFMAPIDVFHTGIWNRTSYSISIISNSSVSAFYFCPEAGPFLEFNITGDDKTSGFCRMIIPRDMLWDEDIWEVYVGDKPLIPLVDSNNEFTYLYFVYQHGAKIVRIYGSHVIPEFIPIVATLLFIFTLLLMVLMHGKQS